MTDEEEERSLGAPRSWVRQRTAPGTLGASPPAAPAAAGAGGGICSRRGRAPRFKVPGGGSAAAQTARRRWACPGVPRGWAFVPGVERAGGEAALPGAAGSVFEC